MKIIKEVVGIETRIKLSYKPPAHLVQRLECLPHSVDNGSLPAPSVGTQQPALLVSKTFCVYLF